MRALAQSIAREFQPQGIHVAHIIIDGPIYSEKVKAWGLKEEKCLNADAIAETYLSKVKMEVWRGFLFTPIKIKYMHIPSLLDVHNQNKQCWTLELDVRTFQEEF